MNREPRYEKVSADGRVCTIKMTLFGWRNWAKTIGSKLKVNAAGDRYLLEDSDGNTSELREVKTNVA